jgi:ABC-type antimicrobial peptide transport system permease subunit
LKIVIRINKRILATTFGIALCVMYLVGTMAMVQGLHESTKNTADLYEQEYLFVYNGVTISESRIDSGIIDNIPGRFAACLLTIANVSGTETRILAIEDPNHIIDCGNITLDNEILPGSGINFNNATSLNLTSSFASLSMNISLGYEPYTSVIFPDNWILAPKDTVRSLNPQLSYNYSFIIIPEDNQQALDYLKSNDIKGIPSVGIVKFFQLGFYQVENNLWGVVMSSTLIIIILIYNIMSIETQYRIPDIKIIKYLGASPQTVIYVFLFQAIFICGVGAIFGLALGIIAANSIVSLSQLLGFSSVLVPQVTPYIVGLPFVLAVSGGLIGGFFPAYKASKTTIRASREVL